MAIEDKNAKRMQRIGGLPPAIAKHKPLCRIRHGQAGVAGRAATRPTTDDFVDAGLPFGPQPRLVLYHLNAETLRTQSPHIELDDSLTAFVKRTLGIDTSSAFSEPRSGKSPPSPAR
jgi:hypothetical protein